MKRLYVSFVLALIFLPATRGFAQQGQYSNASPECLKNLSFYKEYIKLENYQEAAPLWREAFRLCPPGVSQNLYIDGQYIFKFFIENNKNNSKLRISLIDSLLMLYNLRIEYFPKYVATALTYKAYDMANYLDEKDVDVLMVLEETIKVAGSKTEPDILVLAMERVCKMYTNKILPPEKVIATYSSITPVIESQISANHPKANQAKRVIDILFANSGVANCENIVKIFYPKFKENPTDKELVSRIVTLLSNAGCYNEELLITTVEALHKMEPTYKTAKVLFKLYSAREKNQEAMRFLQEAINSPESNDIEDADMLMLMATYYFKKMESPAKAAEAARQAVQKNIAVAGVSNLLMATIWANHKCSGNEIEKRANFWVAVDYLNRARNADSSLTEEANKLIGTYSQYFPLKEEAFMYDIIDGASFTVNCGGMSATTTVRTRR